MPIVTFTVRAREARPDPLLAGAGARRTTIERPGAGDETDPPAPVIKTFEVYNTEGLLVDSVIGSAFKNTTNIPIADARYAEHLAEHLKGMMT